MPYSVNDMPGRMGPVRFPMTKMRVIVGLNVGGAQERGRRIEDLVRELEAAAAVELVRARLGEDLDAPVIKSYSYRTSIHQGYTCWYILYRAFC